MDSGDPRTEQFRERLREIFDECQHLELRSGSQLAEAISDPTWNDNVVESPAVLEIARFLDRDTVDFDRLVDAVSKEYSTSSEAEADLDDLADRLFRWQGGVDSSCPICEAPLLSAPDAPWKLATCEHLVAAVQEEYGILESFEDGFGLPDLVLEAGTLSDCISPLVERAGLVEGDPADREILQRFSQLAFPDNEPPAWWSDLSDILHDGGTVGDFVRRHLTDLAGRRCQVGWIDNTHPGGGEYIDLFWSANPKESSEAINGELEMLCGETARIADRLRGVST